MKGKGQLFCSRDVCFTVSQCGSKCFSAKVHENNNIPLCIFYNVGLIANENVALQEYCFNIQTESKQKSISSQTSVIQPVKPCKTTQATVISNQKKEQCVFVGVLE